MFEIYITFFFSYFSSPFSFSVFHILTFLSTSLYSFPYPFHLPIFSLSYSPNNRDVVPWIDRLCGYKLDPRFFLWPLTLLPFSFVVIKSHQTYKERLSGKIWPTGFPLPFKYSNCVFKPVQPTQELVNFRRRVSRLEWMLESIFGYRQHLARWPLTQVITLWIICLRKSSPINIDLNVYPTLRRLFNRCSSLRCSR